MTQILLLIHVVSGCTFAKGRQTREEALRPKFIKGKGIAANGANVYEGCDFETLNCQTI